MSTTHTISTPRHIHTYVRYKRNQWKRKDLYRCNDPYCNHYAERTFIVGKASLCTKCKNEFILTMEDLKLAMPRCINCSNTKEAIERRAARSLVSRLGLDLDPLVLFPLDPLSQAHTTGNTPGNKIKPNGE